MDCVSNYLYNDKAGIGLINMLVLARSQYYNVIFIQETVNLSILQWLMAILCIYWCLHYNLYLISSYYGNIWSDLNFCQNYKNYNKISKQSWINICQIWQGFPCLPTFSNRAVLAGGLLDSALLWEEKGLMMFRMKLEVSRSVGSCLMSKYGGGQPYSASWCCKD